jgi:predicted CoA-substrate-specific enzyme activase
MTYSLGVDIGSISIKIALADDQGSILHLDHRKITSSPGQTVIAMIESLGQKFLLEQIKSAGVSGSGKAVIPVSLGWQEFSSPLAIASGVLHFQPEARTIIQIGGQSSLIIELEDGLNKPWRVTSNPLCAAGTGRFLEQQAYRLGISMDDFADMALSCEGAAPRIAARCSVFAKSDLIHLQQKGAPVESMLYALCESIARMVGSLKKGKIQEPVYFTGGVAANAAIARALNEMLYARNGHPVQVNIPPDYLYLEAIGSALLSRGKTVKSIVFNESGPGQSYFQLPPLENVAAANIRPLSKMVQKCRGYLGVDVGSTSTKAIIIDEAGKNVLGKCYLMTAGKPIDAVKEVFKNLINDGAELVEIAGVGVTGSGRYLVGSFIGADLVKNEITAQTRAAAEIDPGADIIEIGGQDSKLVIKRNGVVVDYQMNKACAAGTGSFIDELAEMLGVSVKSGEFADLAFTTQHTIDLGTRCAAFMGQAVASAQQEGVSLPVLTASLANSIARNYLSKVVGHRKLGNRVILTGAVFHNRAVVSAFRRQLEGKTLTVAEHMETSGAIGAAMLARESMSRKSSFKGFSNVVADECKLSTFTCKYCDNNCTITRMQTPGEKPTFYGSRCDRYDSTLGLARVVTSFDEKEKILFKDRDGDNGKGPAVGIPRSLLVYDYAPLLAGFLGALGARAVFSGHTSKQIMEHAVELSYSDSCFPIKLLHGHAASLKDIDYLLFPCAIRLGEKDGDENQRYSCPLVQASPFIIRQALDLKAKLLVPIIDFTYGTKETINNLTAAGVEMGFSRARARKAALEGLQAQRKYEEDRDELGKRLLEEIHDKKQLGVVLFSRSYMSQDAGANLGIAEKLAQLGVIPVPMDYLPLSTIDPKKYSDRPYWLYESKLIAAAAITAADPQLYGLILTNFGCGPNSFILRIVEDIMGGKPLGQLEIDEHAAEAGIVTRLEAFVDTIKGYSDSARQPAPGAHIYRGASPSISSGKTLIVPRMAPHAEAVAAAMSACGVKASVMPESDERSLIYANQMTTGTECLPYRVCLGDFIRYYRDNGGVTREVEAFMAGSYGPCRLGKYSIEQMRVLQEMGIDIPIRTSVSNSAYRDLNIGPDFERLAWRGIVAFDYLQKLLWRTRPYEKERLAADNMFKEYTGKVVKLIGRKGDFNGVMKEAVSAFAGLIDRDLPRRPVVGINGEIFLRSNDFSNSNLVRECENAGLEVVVSPLGEWFKYTAYRNLEDATRDKLLKKSLLSYIKKRVQEHDENAVASLCTALLDEKEPSTEALLKLSGEYLSPRCGSEAVLSLGSGIDWMKSPHFAGAISVMPHGCMPGGIVAAMSDKFSATYRKPWINLTYDGFIETNNLAKINNFAEVLRFCSPTS